MIHLHTTYAYIVFLFVAIQEIQTKPRIKQRLLCDIYLFIFSLLYLYRKVFSQVYIHLPSMTVRSCYNDQ